MDNDSSSPPGVPADDSGDTNMKQMRVSLENLEALKELKSQKGLGNLDAALTLLIESHRSTERWTTLGAPPMVAQRLSAVDRGLSTLLILSRDTLTLAERLESGAIGREIALGNALARELEALAAAKVRPA